MIKYKIKNTDLISFKKKRLARHAVTKALRKNDLQRSLFCESCNRETKTEAHHIDYGKPLSVIWLCDKCHGKAHREDSDLNPLNHEQTPIPIYWEKSDMVTVSFNIPVKQFMILKEESKNTNKKLSTILRDNLVKSYPVESSQLEFNFEGIDDERNNECNENIQSMGENESEMLQQKLSSISTLRRERDYCLPGMEEKPADFYFRHGSNTRQLQLSCSY